jgi:deoxyribonuclease V
MILAVDVHYTRNRARVAGVVFESWEDQLPQGIYVSTIESVAEYEPGMFFKRELPCILKLITENELRPEMIIVDGYVYLDGQSDPGLGKHLYDALNGEVIVIGVAKKRFTGIDARHEVHRGDSKRPLYVTAVGLEVDRAKEYIHRMHGKSRLPSLIKRVDQVCRGTVE